LRPRNRFVRPAASSTIKEAHARQTQARQNFLDDAEAIQRIAASIGDLTGRTVVEIGPGGGAITGELAARAAHVLAVELDHELASSCVCSFLRVA